MVSKRAVNGVIAGATVLALGIPALTAGATTRGAAETATSPRQSISLPSGLATQEVSDYSTDGYTVRVLNSRGISKNNPAPGRNGGIDIPLFDVMTGKQVGIAHHNFLCMPPAYCNDIDTYKLPEGSLTVMGTPSVMPDPQQPDGWMLVHTPPVTHKLEGTGIFAGKNGWVRTTGTANVKNFPAEVELNEVHIIAYK